MHLFTACNTYSSRISFFLTGVAFASALSTDKQCKCLPNSPCWPTEDEWQRFNATIDGILVSVHPIASACYNGTEYQPTRCEEIERNFTNSKWRSEQLGALQHPNWEWYLPANETCPLPAFARADCKQGSIPLYAVPARSPQDISAAVRFVKHRKIPLTIKNTGHDLLGRSARKDSLMIWTHQMNSIEFINQDGTWTPAGCGAGKEKETELLVKISAGVQLRELYQAVGRQNRTVVAGTANTVGAAGGYIQGGGHSILGPWKGMASDHAVEFEIVTADGKHRKASACQNADLFWALRGGGGGTFGVVTSVTLRTFENPPSVFYSFNITIPTTFVDESMTTESFRWELVTRWHSLAVAVSDLGGGGYYFMLPGNLFISMLLFAGSNSTDPIVELFKPFESWVYDNISGRTNSNATSRRITLLSRTSDIFDMLLRGYDTTGTPTLVGSRLLSREALSSTSGIAKVTSAFREINKLGEGRMAILGNYIAGGKVAQNANSVDSALHPAWRKALSHIIIVSQGALGAPFPQELIQQLMTEKLVPQLKKLDFEQGRQTMGAYFNEADKEDVDWQDSFWGRENYARLRRIKQQWDPEGLFWCRPCVGSEDWDKYGVCKVSKR